MADFRRWLQAAVAALALGAPAAAQGERIAIGSKNFTESRLLAEIMAQAIEEQTGLEVERRFDLGGTMVAFTALQEGEIDLYAEYTGTAWAVLLGHSEPPESGLETFLRSQAELRSRFDLELLTTFGFDNTYAMALRGDLARELGIERLSELAAFGDRVRGGFTAEFTEREDGLPGLLERYGIELADVRAMEHALAYEGLRIGELDLVDAYATDGKLLEYDLVVLADDLGYFPPYHAAPLVRRDLIERHPEVLDALAPLAFAIDERRMAELNHAVEVAGGSFEDQARLALVEVGLAEARAGAGESDNSLGAFVAGRVAPTLSLGLEHLAMTFASVVLAALVAIPGGLLLLERERAARLALGLTGVLQTVPSIALLAVLIAVPGLGLSAGTAIVALFLYALLPILRNTLSGLRAVDADLVDAAAGLGLDPGQVLTRVRLPIAVPAIMAGLRTAAVISVGVATLAAFIGAGGLGEPIVTGLYLNDTRLILAGALPAAALALAVDAILGLVERRLTPRGLRLGGAPGGE